MRKKRIWKKAAMLLSATLLLTGCGAGKSGTPDDYATNNVKSEKTDSAKKTSEGIAKDKIKVGVVHLSVPMGLPRRILRLVCCIFLIHQREVVILTLTIWV